VDMAHTAISTREHGAASALLHLQMHLVLSVLRLWRRLLASAVTTDSQVATSRPLRLARLRPSSVFVLLDMEASSARNGKREHCLWTA
jgi:hypothetical protein